MLSKTKTVILTGATGFLGSFLLESFVSCMIKVVLIKRSYSETFRIDHLLKKVVIVDADKQSLEDAFMYEKVDAVVHTACSYGRGDEKVCGVVEANVLFPLNLLELSIKHNVPLFINTDTFFNNANEINNYMQSYVVSKRHFVDWLKVYSNRIKVINLILQHVYGPNDNDDKFSVWLLDQMRSEVDRILLTSGCQKRDFIYVEDVISAYNCLLDVQLDDSFSQFHVGTGVQLSIKEFVLTMRAELEKVLGRKIKSRLCFGGLVAQQSEFETPVISTDGLLRHGWKPKYTLQSGLRKMLEVSL